VARLFSPSICELVGANPAFATADLTFLSLSAASASVPAQNASLGTGSYIYHTGPNDVQSLTPSFTKLYRTGIPII